MVLMRQHQPFLVDSHEQSIHSFRIRKRLKTEPTRTYMAFHIAAITRFVPVWVSASRVGRVAIHNDLIADCGARWGKAVPIPNRVEFYSPFFTGRERNQPGHVVQSTAPKTLHRRNRARIQSASVRRRTRYETSGAIRASASDMTKPTATLSFRSIYDFMDKHDRIRRT